VTDAELRVVGRVTPDSGVQAHRVAVVLAQVHALPDGGPPDDEVAEVRWVAPDQLEREIAHGAVEDGFTLAALTLARVHRLL
jgi:isopentenyldiphosphate isomerase